LRFLLRDGVQLACEDEGAGEPVLLCIHGNSCNHAFFRPQIEHFEKTQRVVALDLRGHGLSDAPRGEYTFAALAEDCAWVCEELGLKRVVVLGHSMGGAVAVEMIKAHPGLARAVALLDSTLLPDPVTLQKVLPPLINELEIRDHLQGMHDFVGPLFAPGDSAEVREWVWQEMSRTPAHVTNALFEEFLNWRDQATPHLFQPFLYVASFHWRCDPAALARACPQVQTAQIKESGHFLTLSAADRINAMVGDFLERVAANK
jgi:pimeloyl-ACP methyl ester carboxylesterase